MKWIIESANEKDRSVRIWDKLANELLDAYRGEVNNYLMYSKFDKLIYFLANPSNSYVLSIDIKYM